MAVRISWIALLGLTTAGVAACDVTGPLPTKPIEFNFCAAGFSGVPGLPLGLSSGLSYANEGAAWQSAGIEPDGFVRFDATQRVRLQYKIDAGLTRVVLSATADELAELRCPPSIGGAERYGLSEWANAEPFRGAVGGFTFNGGAPGPSAGTASAVTGPLDLVVVATRTPYSNRRIAIRRRVDLDDADPIPALNFEGEEAAPFASGTLTVSGTGSAPIAADVVLRTPTTAVMFSAMEQPASSGSFWAPSILAGTDRQYLWVRSGSGEAERGVLTFFGSPPSTLSVDVGPELGSLVSGGMGRVVVEPPYDDIIGVSYSTRVHVFNQVVTHRVHWFMTAKYLGGQPQHWEFRLTDLALDRSYEGGQVILAASGRLATLFGGVGEEGEVLRYAGGVPYLPYPKGR